MRYLVVVLVLAACDLQPAPKREPAPASATPTPPGPAPSVPAAVAIDAGAAPFAPTDAAAPVRPPVDAMEVSDTCVTVSAHVADVVIADVKDPAHKAVYTQERARMIRRSAEACTRDAWSSERIACYLKTKTQRDIQDCNEAHVK